MFPKSPKIQEYQNHYPKSTKIHRKSPKIPPNLLKSMKNTKFLKTHMSQRENDLRPKLVPTTLAVLGVLSSCPRVMTMQCWKSQIPPPLSTRLRVYLFVVVFLVLCWPKRKETRPSKIPQRNKNSKTSEKLTCTCSPNPQKSKNIKTTTQNHQKSIKITKKIHRNLLKAMKKHKKNSKKHKVKGKTT